MSPTMRESLIEPGTSKLSSAVMSLGFDTSSASSLLVVTQLYSPLSSLAYSPQPVNITSAVSPRRYISNGVAGRSR